MPFRALADLESFGMKSRTVGCPHAGAGGAGGRWWNWRRQPARGMAKARSTARLCRFSGPYANAELAMAEPREGPCLNAVHRAAVGAVHRRSAPGAEPRGSSVRLAAVETRRRRRYRGSSRQPGDRKPRAETPKRGADERPLTRYSRSGSATPPSRCRRARGRRQTRVHEYGQRHRSPGASRHRRPTSRGMVRMPMRSYGASPQPRG